LHLGESWVDFRRSARLIHARTRSRHAPRCTARTMGAGVPGSLVGVRS
jgi:hypothetical protein